MWSQLALIGPENRCSSIPSPARSRRCRPLGRVGRSVPRRRGWAGDPGRRARRGPRAHRREEPARSEQRFRDLADNTADVVWRFTTTPPHFDYISPSVQTLLNHPAVYFLEDTTRLVGMLDEEAGRWPRPRFVARRRPRGATCASIVTTGSSSSPRPPRLRSRAGSRACAATSLTAPAAGEPCITRVARPAHRPRESAASQRVVRVADEPRSTGRGTLAVAFLDLDGFKGVNDRFGSRGRETSVLCETARRLLATVRVADVVARIGGDEFVVVYQPTEDSDDDVVAAIVARSKCPSISARAPRSSARPASATPTRRPSVTTRTRCSPAATTRCTSSSGPAGSTRSAERPAPRTQRYREPVTSNRLAQETSPYLRQHKGQRSTGTRGDRRRSPPPRSAKSRSCCPSATAPATGAM